MYKLTRLLLIATVMLAAYCVIMLVMLVPWAWVALAIGAGIALARRGYRYTAFGTYGLSKLCNILWSGELARRLEGAGVTANCFHPGGVNTGFGSNSRGLMGTLLGLGKRFMLSPIRTSFTKGEP